MEENKDKKMPQRLKSLDALRGFDMMFLMGVAGLISTCAQLFHGSFPKFIASQMHHVSWNGLAHHDTIFPLFLFLAGVSWPFSMAKQLEKGKTKKDLYKKIITRGLTLFVLGLIYNGLLNLDFAHQRYCSVLGRIGLAWMFAALIFINTRRNTRIWITAAILVGYWLVAAYIPAPDANGADIFTPQGSFICYVDRLLLPNCGTFDPEGVLSTLPAICTALLGMFTGELVKSDKEGLTENKKVLYMIVAGLVLLAVGLLWDQVFPINKKLWTSSFVCAVGAYSVLTFAMFYWLIDVKKWWKSTLFFTVIGMNSITIYLATKFINFSYIAHQLTEGVSQLFPDSMQEVLGYVFIIPTLWLFLYFLYRQRIFLKV